MKLYVKGGCPWCIDAVAWLEHEGYGFEEIDVLRDREAYQRMIEISGQRRAPTLELANGAVLKDFGVEELPAFLATHAVEPVAR